MSLEIGPSVGFVYLTDDGLNGFSLDALHTTRGEVADSVPEQVELLDALDEVIYATDSPEVTLDRARSQGRFLLGISDQSVDDMVTAPPDAVLFAKVGQLDTKSGAFAVVRLVTWARQSKEEMTKQLLDMSLVDVVHSGVPEREYPEIPVSRLTRILPFRPSEEDPEEEGYIYGFCAEEHAVEVLDVPERLKNLLGFVTRAWHRSEIANPGQGGSFAMVQDELHDRQF